MRFHSTHGFVDGVFSGGLMARLGVAAVVCAIVAGLAAWGLSG
jgi:hypothetical protein